jgi:Armadillo/beta-catenin-like repeat
MSAVSDKNKDALAAAGAIPLLVRLLSKSSANVQVRIAAWRRLGCCFEPSFTWACVVSQQQIVAALWNLADTGAWWLQTSTAPAFGLVDGSVAAANQVTIAKAGGVEALVGLLRSPSPAVQARGVGMRMLM